MKLVVNSVFLALFGAVTCAADPPCTPEGCTSADGNGKNGCKQVVSFVDIKKTCYDVEYKTVCLPATVLPGDKTACGDGCGSGDGSGDGQGCGEDGCGEDCGYKPGFLSRIRSALGMDCGARTRCVATPKKSAKKIGEKCVAKWECAEEPCGDNCDCHDKSCGKSCCACGDEGCAAGADGGDGDACGEACGTYKPGFMERVRKALGRKSRSSAASCGEESNGEGCAAAGAAAGGKGCADAGAAAGGKGCADAGADAGGKGCADAGADAGGKGCADAGGKGCADAGGDGSADGCGESCKPYKPGFLARLRSALGGRSKANCGDACGDGGGEGCTDGGGEGCNGSDENAAPVPPPTTTAGRVYYQF